MAEIYQINQYKPIGENPTPDEAQVCDVLNEHEQTIAALCQEHMDHDEKINMLKDMSFLLAEELKYMQSLNLWVLATTALIVIGSAFGIWWWL